MQCIGTDGAISRWVRADIAKMKDEHVSGSPNDREPKTGQHLESIQLHVATSVLHCSGHIGRNKPQTFQSSEFRGRQGSYVSTN